MLTLEDCLALSDLMQGEIDAIAQHEHLPEVIAIQLGCYLVHCPDGREALRAMISDDIKAAQSHNDLRRAAELNLLLEQFIERCRRDPALCGRWNEPAGSRF